MGKQTPPAAYLFGQINDIFSIPDSSSAIIPPLLRFVTQDFSCARHSINLIMSADSPATAPATELDAYANFASPVNCPEHLRGVHDLSTGTLDYIMGDLRFFRSIINASPKRCRDLFACQENFDYTRAIYENAEYIVNGYLPWKRVPSSVLEQTMTRATTEVLAGKYERSFSMDGVYQITGKQILVPCPELIKRCAQAHIMLNPQLISVHFN